MNIYLSKDNKKVVLFVRMLFVAVFLLFATIAWVEFYDNKSMALFLILLLGTTLMVLYLVCTQSEKSILVDKNTLVFQNNFIPGKRKREINLEDCKKAVVYLTQSTRIRADSIIFHYEEKKVAITLSFSQIGLENLIRTLKFHGITIKYKGNPLKWQAQIIEKYKESDSVMQGHIK